MHRHIITIIIYNYNKYSRANPGRANPKPEKEGPTPTQRADRNPKGQPLSSFPPSYMYIYISFFKRILFVIVIITSECWATPSPRQKEQPRQQEGRANPHPKRGKGQPQTRKGRANPDPKGQPQQQEGRANPHPKGQLQPREGPTPSQEWEGHIYNQNYTCNFFIIIIVIIKYNCIFFVFFSLFFLQILIIVTIVTVILITLFLKKICNFNYNCFFVFFFFFFPFFLLEI